MTPGFHRVWHDDLDPALPPMSDEAKAWQKRAQAYLAKKTCRVCRKVDSDGSKGPGVPISAHPVVVDVGIERHSEHWYCATHSAEVWSAHLRHLKQLSARLDRLELWKRGGLEWQRPRIWIQLELFPCE